MFPISAAIKGGKITGKESRRKALERYYENPKVCKFCNKIIDVRDNEKIKNVRMRKFCTIECYKNFRRDNVKPKMKNKKGVGRGRKKWPPEEFSVHNKTKGELLTSRLNFQSARGAIVKHAKAVYEFSSKLKVCVICGYSKHIEICHIKNVSDFDVNVKINEINNINNLIALCRNHHWEFDNGLIHEEELRSRTVASSSGSYPEGR